METVYFIQNGKISKLLFHKWEGRCKKLKGNGAKEYY